MAYNPINFNNGRAGGTPVSANNLRHMEAGITSAHNSIESIASDVAGLTERYGTPLVAHTASEMTEQNRIYVYVGSETGYTAGNWYYYNGTTWASGGTYQSNGINTDKSLTQADMAADAKEVGDQFDELKSQISQSGGVSSTARNLLNTILKNALYKTDQSANIDALIIALTPSTPAPTVKYSITYNLTNVTSDTSTSQVNEGSPFSCTLTPAESAVFDAVTVTMGGTDITSSVYSNGVITIPSVVGNIVITASAMIAAGVVSWDYTKGRLPSADDGIDTVFSGGTTATFESGKGIYITGGASGSDYARYEATNHPTMTKGYFECVATIVQSEQNLNLTARLSNGSSGVNCGAMYVNNVAGWMYRTGASAGGVTSISNSPWEMGKEFTFRVEYDSNGTNHMFKDGVKFYSNNNVTSYYTTVNRFYAQGQVSVYIKSMKWVIEEE